MSEMSLSEKIKTILISSGLKEEDLTNDEQLVLWLKCTLANYKKAKDKLTQIKDILVPFPD